MFKPKKLSVAMALALSSTAGIAVADIEVSGYVKNETAVLLDNEQYIGEETTTLDTNSHHNNTLKVENSVRLFVNGYFGEESSWHLDLNLIADHMAIDNQYDDHMAYSQNDWLREAYVDTTLGNTALRIGKQQVVWGTADGIKLLDIINPTDFREYSQNTMEDSRIPIWMINADIPVGDTGSFQVILAEHEENKIPGLDADGDEGHPFTAKGVDSITGRVNGFMSVAPALSRVAASFTNTAILGGFDFVGGTGFGSLPDGTGDANPSGLTNFSGLTVSGFANANQNVNNPGTLAQNITAPGAPAPAGSVSIPGQTLLNAIAQGGINPFGDSNANGNTANLVSGVYNPSAADSAFEYMPNATFATFNTFAGQNGNAGAGFGGATYAGITSEYVRDYPSDGDGNFGFRYKNSTDSGMSYSFNYFYHYDANPVVDISWHDSVTGQELQTVLARAGDLFDATVPGTGAPGQDGRPDFADPNNLTPGAVFGGTVSRSAVPSNAATSTPVSVLLRNPTNGQYYGAVNPTGGLGGTVLSANAPVLRFTESLNRIHSIGGSFDYAIDSFETPVVLRGEFLYNQDEMHPVVDKRLLAIGDLEGALTPEEHDMFKYVIGVDVTVLTNMLVSTQFIQFRNLDYQDDGRTCTTQTLRTFDCSRYTADAPTLHLSNGLNQAEENKEFVSLFFSKPFGSEQQGRWNNITIFEDVGGYWNRFDVEYGWSDRVILSAELNTYWGDEDSWFGQMENTSNVQVGMKYIFE